MSITFLLTLIEKKNLYKSICIHRHVDQTVGSLPKFVFGDQYLYGTPPNIRRQYANCVL